MSMVLTAASMHGVDSSEHGVDSSEYGIDSSEYGIDSSEWGENQTLKSLWGETHHLRKVPPPTY